MGKRCIAADTSLGLFGVLNWLTTVKSCAPTDQPFAERVERDKQESLDYCLTKLCPIVKKGTWASRLGMGRKKAIKSPWNKYEDGLNAGWKKTLGDKCVGVAYTTFQGQYPDVHSLMHLAPKRFSNSASSWSGSYPKSVFLVFQ